MNCQRFSGPAIVGVGVLLCSIGGFMCWGEQNSLGGQILFGIGLAIFIMGGIISLLPKREPRDTIYYSSVNYNSV